MTVCDPRIWAGRDMLGQTSPMVPCAWRQGRSNGRTILTSSQATGRRIGITSESFACALKWNLQTLDGLTFAGHRGTTPRPISPSLNFAATIVKPAQTCHAAPNGRARSKPFPVRIGRGRRRRSATRSTQGLCCMVRTAWRQRRKTPAGLGISAGTSEPHDGPDGKMVNAR